MSNSDLLHIAVAESSILLRRGVIATLKSILGNSKHFIEIASSDQLQESLRLHRPDIVIVNPLFANLLDISKLKCNYQFKSIALQTSLSDKMVLNGYDGVLSLYDDEQEIAKLFESLIEKERETDSQEDVLSQREKEIIVCIVKGMTNKEIADKLFISVHTVITHRRNITRKLEIHSSAGLTIYAIINKLVDIAEVSL